MGSMDGAIVQVYGDEIHYRASAIGTPCLKQLIAARMEYSAVAVPGKMQTVFDKGHATEDRIIKQMTKADPSNWTVYRRQDEVRFRVTGKISVVAHMDGVRVPSYRIVEVKSQSEKEFTGRFEDSAFHERYLWQVSSMMHATGFGCDVVVVKRSNSEEGDLDYYIHSFEEPPISAADIRRKVLAVEGASRNDKLPDQCGTVVYPCPYFYLHSEVVASGEGTSEVVGLDDPGLLVLARQYERASVEEKQAKAKKDETRRAIEAAVGTVGKYEVDVDGQVVKISWSDRSRYTVSKDLLSEAGIDPKQYSTVSEYRVMTVKFVGE